MSAIEPSPSSTRGMRSAPSEPDAGLIRRPAVVLEADQGWSGIRFGDLWQYRELLYFLTWRDVKVRYKQSLLGAAWAILQPLLLMLIFTFFIARLGSINSSGVPYPLFAYVGLLPWTFFANAITSSGNSLVGSTNLITKVYFPRMLIPAAAVAAGLVDFCIAFLLLVAMMFYYRVGFHSTILLLPLLLILTTLLAVGVGMGMAALNVKYRDVRHALPFLIQIWMFASPVIYPLPQKWHRLLALNPMTGIIEGFRAVLFGQSVDWSTLGVSGIITALVLVISALTFRRMEKSFADII